VRDEERNRRKCARVANASVRIGCGYGSAGKARYNWFPIMPGSRYALVAYVRNPVGEFIEKLRRELHPELPHLAAHITVLPPRTLQGSEDSVIQTLEENCRDLEPFEVTLGEVETFIPVTPTVFIRVAHAAVRMQALHDQLNRDGVCCSEQLPYVPHLTIAKMGSEELAWKAFELARRRWSKYTGTRHIALEELTFVREAEGNRWVDLAPVLLGRKVTSRPK
jgi:2'-5' RNA ligase